MDALAQDGIAIDRHQPSVVGDRFFGVPSATTTGHLVPRAGLFLDYAREPLVLVRRCVSPEDLCEAQDDEDQGAVVRDQLLMHAAVSLALWNRLLVSVNMPLALVNQGDDPAGSNGTALPSPSGVAAGDLRLGARVRLVGEARDAAQLAVGGYFWAPTGDSEAYTGNGSARGMPHVTLSGLIETGASASLIYGVQAGTTIRDKVETMGATMGTELTFGGGMGVLVLDETLQLGPEIYGTTVLVDGGPFRDDTTSAELLFGGRYRFVDDFTVGVAGGPGLTPGVGTPAGRFVSQLAYSPLGEAVDTDDDGIFDDDDACPTIPGVASRDPEKHGCPADQDGDGIIDDEDACPRVSGVPHRDPKKNGCPPDRDNDTIVDGEDACPEVPGVRHVDPKKNGCPPDKDGDGIVDSEDACPTVVGVRHPDPKKNGCPPDKDGDTIFDGEDACPEVPGVRDPDPTKNGCPRDTDGDTIVDPEDACPLEKGPRDPDPTKNGCPTLVRVTKTEIKILQQPRFAFGQAIIMPQSEELLQQVAHVLAEHPEILKVRIEGHTDSRGGDAYNKALSDRRAKAVRDWLVKNGVDADRLDPQGWGEEKPIASNDSDEGRAKNRRVEFHIVERKERPDAQP